MEYRDEQFGFTLTLPEGWRHSKLRRSFTATGGKAAFLPPPLTSRGTLNVSVGTRNVILDRDVRERAARRFMKLNAILSLKWRARIVATDRLLGEEPNTAWVEMRQAGGGGVVEQVDGLVEAVRNGRAYAVQYMQFPESADEIQGIVSSFRFLW